MHTTIGRLAYSAAASLKSVEAKAGDGDSFGCYGDDGRGGSNCGCDE